ncbi:DUF45 domain-containing protein [Cryomorphaceae bacterium S-15]|uniref:DUF45 domain-containing protein n=2 Tax=Acidiluteibacter ferrifornacis TaxID=2692424 RepID=A0A6N9NN65_9FLAO|nr:DUF45 domain-containing protein [Acidiluteibacter ferrifornacis]
MHQGGKTQFLMEVLTYGHIDLSYTLERHDRKSLGIEVHPDLSIVAKAPETASFEDIEGKLLKRARWIVKQQQYFEQFLPRKPKSEYFSGETHYYLGKSFLLKARVGDTKTVKMKNGCLWVTHPNPSPSITKTLLTDWYYQHANKMFENKFEVNFKKFERFQLSKPELEIRRMKNRWGSCSAQGIIRLNPELIKTPSPCIDYVIIHELCHLIEPNHSKQFYELLERQLPNYQFLKGRLEKFEL